MDELEQLHDVRREIKRLKELISKAERTAVADTVIASVEPYYMPHRVVIRGVPVVLIDKLRRRERQLLEKILETEMFIDTIDDSLVRQVIMLRYSMGLSWSETARRCGARNESVPRVLLKRFFGKG